MRKTTPAPHSAYPSRMPAFMTDFKFTNYGMYEGRLVCHDYGMLPAHTDFTSAKTQPASWLDRDYK